MALTIEPSKSFSNTKQSTVDLKSSEIAYLTAERKSRSHDFVNDDRTLHTMGQAPLECPEMESFEKSWRPDTFFPALFSVSPSETTHQQDETQTQLRRKPTSHIA
jgi:hypothetical protein